MLDLLQLLPNRVWSLTHNRPLVVNAALTATVIAANTGMQIRLNAWNGDFYAAIERRDYDSFVTQLGVFVVIAAILLVLVVAQTWLQELGKVLLRTEITRGLLDRWLAPRAPYRLGLAGEVGVHPDQRLQEDVRHFSELSVVLATGLLQSSMLLLSFVGVLWTLSSTIPITVLGVTIEVDGLLLWGTLAFSLIGSLLTYWIGAPLVSLQRTRYAREADFRFAVVQVAEGAQEIAFDRGEAAERHLLDAAFDRTRAAMVSLANATARVTWVTSGYGWLAIVAPVVLAAPAFFAGALTFGQLMMAVQAFYQVQQSLRWYVDNYPTIADWRATRTRVDEFHRALEALDALGADAPRIVVAPHPEGRLAFEDLSIRLPDGSATFDRPRVEIARGERVLIVGQAGAGKSTLLRAMAGLWPWGSGTILMPADDEVMFLSEAPFLPAGNLADALAYPSPRARWTDAEYAAALNRVGLAEHIPAMSTVKRWDRELSRQEKQSLSFARLLLRRPQWVFLDEATSACMEDRCDTLLAILTAELGEAAVIGLARTPSNGLYSRTAQLVRRPAPKIQLDLADAGAADLLPRLQPPPAGRDGPGRTTPVRLAGTRPAALSDRGPD